MATLERTFPFPRARYTGILEWITTTDHKKIGVMYLVTTFFFFLMGGLLALGIRTQLATADNTFLNAQQYNAAFTMHGLTMVFLFVVPVWTGFANYIVPLQLGARDMAFPRLNALSYWLLLAGGIILYSAFIVGPPMTGWTMYAPLSTREFMPGNGKVRSRVAMRVHSIVREWACQTLSAASASEPEQALAEVEYGDRDKHPREPADIA